MQTSSSDTLVQPTRPKPRPYARGTTLVEVLIVVAIIALVAGGVGAAAFEYWIRAKTKHAVASAHVIRQAAKTWLAENDAGECPDFASLTNAGLLDRGGATHDPWNGPWRIECTGNDVIVGSKGSDGRADTEDDIVVPKAEALASNTKSL